jgi:hypothetical protein
MPHSHHHHMHNHVRSETHAGSPSSASQTINMLESASRVLVARAKATCTNDSDPGCTKPTQVPTMAIALAAMYVSMPYCPDCANSSQSTHRRYRNCTLLPSSPQ